MKHFNKLKDQLRPEQSKLPEGFGWDDMKDGIFEKIDNDPAVIPPFRLISKNGIILGLSVIIGLLAVTLLYTIDSGDNFTDKMTVQNNTEIPVVILDTNKNDAKNNESSESKDKSSEAINENITNIINKEGVPKYSGNSDISNELPISQISNSNNNIVIVQNNNEEQTQISTREQRNFRNEEPNAKVVEGDSNSRIMTSSSIPFSDTRSEKSKVNKANKDDEISKKANSLKVSKDHADKNFTGIADGNEVIVEDEIELTASKPISNTNKISTENIKIVDRTFDFPYLKPLSGKVKSILDLQLSIGSPITSIPPIVEVQEGKKWTFEIGAGWNLWSHGIDNSIYEDNIYQDTKTDLGYSFSARLSRSIRSNLSLTSGLDYSNLFNEFRSTTISHQNRLVKDTVVSYVVNHFSGDTSHHKGDVYVVDTLVKNTLHYNRFQTVTIPLIVNYTVKKGRWSLNAGVGPSITFLREYNGKYKSNEILVEYDTSSDLYNTSPKIALNANLGINVELTRDIFAGFRIELKNNLSNWGTENGNGLKPRIVSGQFSLGTRF